MIQCGRFHTFFYDVCGSGQPALPELQHRQHQKYSKRAKDALFYACAITECTLVGNEGVCVCTVCRTRLQYSGRSCQCRAACTRVAPAARSWPAACEPAGLGTLTTMAPCIGSRELTGSSSGVTRFGQQGRGGSTREFQCSLGAGGPCVPAGMFLPAFKPVNLATEARRVRS